MSTVGRQIYSLAAPRPIERMCLVTFIVGWILHPTSSSSNETSRLLCLPFFFLQTLLPYKVKEAYKIFIPFFCRNRVKSVTLTASPLTKLFFYTVVQMKQVEPRRFCTMFAAVWVWPIKLLLFFLQFPLCGCMLFIFPGFANSTFISIAQRCILGVQSFSHSFLGLLSTLIHTQLAVCVEKTLTHLFFLTDWQWQQGALPHQDMVHRDTKLWMQSVPQGWSSRLSWCAAQPPTSSTGTSAAFYLTWLFICSLRH